MSDDLAEPERVSSCPRRWRFRRGEPGDGTMWAGWGLQVDLKGSDGIGHRPVRSLPVVVSHPAAARAAVDRADQSLGARADRNRRPHGECIGRGSQCRGFQPLG